MQLVAHRSHNPKVVNRKCWGVHGRWKSNMSQDVQARGPFGLSWEQGKAIFPLVFSAYWHEIGNFSILHSPKLLKEPIWWRFPFVFFRKKINQKSQCEFFQEFWGYNLRKQGEFWYNFCTLDLLTVIMNVPIFYRFHAPWAISSPEDHDHHGYSPELRERLYLYTWRYLNCG